MRLKEFDPLVVGDIGSFCVDCLQDTNFRDAEGNQTFKFVNRMPCDRDVYDGDKCDRCDEKIYCDEDCTPYDVYQGHEPAEFSDGAYRVHYECLTDKEKEIMEANNQ
jgi:hypothetical protein